MSHPAKLLLVQEVGQALSSTLDLDQLLALIMEKVTVLMGADRSTLYLVSEDGKELWSKVLQGGALLHIRLKVGEGIAGWVGASGETVNIPDAYSDRRFYPAVDLRSGYRTRSILCMPMRNTKGAIVGVIQILNKLDGGPFTTEDEALLGALASQAAVAIENSKLYHSVAQKSRELNILFIIEQEVTAAHDLGELLDRLLRRAMEVLGARAGSILLREGSGEHLFYRSTAGEAVERLRGRRVDASEGIVGWVASTRQPVVVNDPASDPRLDRKLAQEMGFAPRTLICVPLVAQGEGGEEVLGVIELLDKDPSIGDASAVFDDEDMKLLVLIAGQASRAIQIARAKEERVNQGRLASIGQMLAGVLHDLKTPMTIVSGYAQLMAQTDDGDVRGQYVEQILKQFDQMTSMPREVLAFARGEVNVLVRKVFMHKFLAEVERHLEHELAGKDVRLVIDAGYRGAAFFDEHKILRVVHNIARNAAQAMTGGGTFRVATRVEGDRLVLELSDTGPGIPPEMEGRLFELFATAGKKDGTGLGLAIVKKIVDEHQGTVSCESRRGPGPTGTTFTVTLPLHKPASLVTPAGGVERLSADEVEAEAESAEA